MNRLIIPIMVAIAIGLATAYIEDRVVGGFDKWVRDFDCQQNPDERGVQACRNTLIIYSIIMAIIPICFGIGTYFKIQAKFRF